MIIIQNSDDDMSDETENRQPYEKEVKRISNQKKVVNSNAKHMRTNHKLLSKFQMYTAQIDHNKST